jgi:signal transduction histidine kinase
MGHLDLLEDDVDTDAGAHLETMRETAGEIISVSEMASRMEAVIEGSGRSGQAVDAVDVVEDRVDAHRRRYPDASISVDAPDSLSVRADGQLDSAIDAIVGNALEHTDREPVIDVRIRTADRETDLVTVAVEDNGPGIPDSEIEILDRPREGPLSHGSGLGLWYVRWYADGHGGELEFDEAPDRGSIVRLRLRPV